MFDFPPAHRIRLRTTIGLQRINRELRQRFRVASIVPTPDSCLRLVLALLAERDDDWMTGKVDLNFNLQPRRPDHQSGDLQKRGCAIRYMWLYNEHLPKKALRHLTPM